jgi:hypothetical protein
VLPTSTVLLDHPVEQPHLLSKRIRFLRKYRQYLETNKYIFIFLDETWNGSQLRQWVNENVPLGVPKVCKNEGERFMILYAGTSTGFLPGCDLLLSSEVEHRDYHKNINVKIFEKRSQH